MPRRPHLILLLLLALLAGCGEPSLTAKDAAACGSLLRELPREVAGQRLADHDSRTASWGDPRIRLTCGVDRPDGFKATSQCVDWNGVAWFLPPSQFSSTPVDVTLTAVSRTPRVQVQVPSRYWPAQAVMVDLAPALKAHLRQTDLCS